MKKNDPIKRGRVGSRENLVKQWYHVGVWKEAGRVKEEWQNRICKYSRLR